jgi:flagellar biosynthetic protein FlhB
MPDKSQKTEKPTQKRIRKAREEGQFQTAREFVGGFQFLFVVMIACSWSAGWFEKLQQTFGSLIADSFQTDLGPGALLQIYESTVARIVLPLLSVGLLVVALTLGLQFAVTRFGFSLTRLTPKFSKFNPIAKLKQLPAQNMAAVVQSLLTLALCSLALYQLARQYGEGLLLLPVMPLDSALGEVFMVARNLLWKGAFVFVIFGCIDFVRQKRRYDSGMRMTKQEIREEFKQVEGNPAIKARIRRIQRSARRRAMLRQVPTATAVVVNPTHFAVALRYDVESMTVPLVVAKGKNYLALRIRKLAEYHDVPLIENPPLAQALYKAVPIGSEIPAHLYRAVAEILAYVYKMMQMR